MQISERTIGDLTILDLKGRLVEGDGADLFRGAIDRLVQLGCLKVLVNMDEVSYVDSWGLGTLVSKYVTLRRRGGQPKLCGLGPRSSRALTITKLLTVIDAFALEADAIKSFGIGSGV